MELSPAEINSRILLVSTGLWIRLYKPSDQRIMGHKNLVMGSAPQSPSSPLAAQAAAGLVQ